MKQVSVRMVEKFKDRFPPEFPQAVPGNVRATYRFVSGEQEFKHLCQLHHKKT